jgi:hypothetical protein
VVYINLTDTGMGNEQMNQDIDVSSGWKLDKRIPDVMIGGILRQSFVFGMCWQGLMTASTRSPKLEGDNAKIDPMTNIVAVHNCIRNVFLQLM